MQYENPKPREGINYSSEHPLKEFSQLLIGIVVIIAVVVITLNALAGRLAFYIPFEFERNMVSDFEFAEVEESLQQAYLQELADRLAPHMDLPEDMKITVHYSDSDTVNAFATLGGNLVFFQGLIEQMESEEELAAVMGHEIAHIKYRHPIVALGKGVTLATLAAFVGGSSASGAGGWLIGSSANLSLLKFSRDQESQADQAAAAGLQALYGHIGGAKDLFQSFAELEGQDSVTNPGVVELFRSHPHSANRWIELQSLADTRGWLVDDARTKLNFPGVASDSEG
ncbi:MAG: M48 family metallopeptidase [Pseudomonadota bacterium]